jgi:5-formyltetrahydrofolate cyclo-ligase
MGIISLRRNPVRLSSLLFRFTGSPVFPPELAIIYPLASSYTPLHFAISFGQHTTTRKMSATTSGSDVDATASVRERKQALRKEIRAKMKALSREEILVESSKVWERLFELPEYKTSRSVSIFLSMPAGEIATEALIQHSIQAGKDVYVPQVGKNFEQADMEMLKIVDPKTADGMLCYHAWPRNKWGVPEPPISGQTVVVAKPGDLDLIVLPGLGFDKGGNRLGQGKGYYDRFIARTALGSDKLPYLVAVGLDCQLVESIPFGDHDRPMDKVLLPSHVIAVKKN